MEEWLGLVQLEIDLIKNKFTTGGLGKSIAVIDGMLADISTQRANIGPAQRLDPLVPIVGLVVKAFSMDEIDDLIFAAGYRPEDIPASGTVQGRARETVDFFLRQGQLEELLSTAKTLRPHELWPEDT